MIKLEAATSTIKICLVALIFTNVVTFGSCTSMKMDFLTLGDVRTDPIISPTCLSDHIHTFYGASEVRPETTYEDLRAASGNSGNVEENKSLYWHPTPYEYDSNTGLYKKDTIFFGSSYYVWETGKATAFPDGFKMVAGFNGDPKARAEAECVDPSPCERDNCATTDTSFFPETACAELEASMVFPTCWNGVDLDSDDHMSHVSYDLEGGRFDGDCPDDFPVKLPEVHFYFRIVPYSGGQHIFSDGTSFYHADYFSGWKATELQSVLDNCSNDSDSAQPDAWCEDHVTFRDAPKEFGDDLGDAIIVDKLTPLQPSPPLDTTTITDEVIDNTSELPRISCTGTLKPSGGSITLAPTPEPTPFPTVAPTSIDGGDTCADSTDKFLASKPGLKGWNKMKTCDGWVTRKSTAWRCFKVGGVKENCAKTCTNCCRDVTETFKLLGNNETKSCTWAAAKPEKRCRKPPTRQLCSVTCNQCD